MTWDSFSGRCNWGFEKFSPQSVVWYVSTTQGNIYKINRDTLLPGDFSTFTDAARVVQVDSEGNFYSYNAFTTAIRKYSFDGTQAWTYNPGVSQFNSPHNFAVDSGLNVYVAGQVDLVGGTTAETVRLTKLDSSGSMVWEFDKTPAELGPSGTFTHLNPTGVCLDLSGNIHITGRRAVGNDGPPQTTRTQGRFEIHVDSDGDEIWSDLSTNINQHNVFGTITNESYGEQCVCDEDGNTYIRYLPTGTVDGITLRGYEPDGTPLFAHTGSAFPLSNQIVWFRGNLYAAGPQTSSAIFFRRFSGSDFTTQDWTYAPGVNGIPRMALDAGSVYGVYGASGPSVVIRRLSQSDGSLIGSGTITSKSPFFPMFPPGLPIIFFT